MHRVVMSGQVVIAFARFQIEFPVFVKFMLFCQRECVDAVSSTGAGDRQRRPAITMLLRSRRKLWNGQDQMFSGDIHGSFSSCLVVGISIPLCWNISLGHAGAKVDSPY
jgi:hypothetical protein